MVRKVLVVLGALSWLGLITDAQFSIPLPPVIVSISPTSGTIGTEITIYGQGFTGYNDIAFTHPDIKWGESNTAYLDGVASSDGRTLRFTLPDILGACAFSQMKPGEACPSVGLPMPVGRIQIAVVHRNGISNSVTFERVKSRLELAQEIIYNSPSYSKLSQVLDEIARRTGRFTSVGIRECDGRICVVVWIEKDVPKLSRKIPTTIEGFEVRVFPWLGELIEIKLTGTAQSFQQLIGGSWWIVRVDRVISGPQPCSEELKVITWTSAAPPVLWGNADPEIKPNDRVQVYGRYTEEAGECSVTLMGSEQYFIRLPIELRSAQIEIRPSSPTTDDEIEVTLRAEFNREFGNPCFAGAQLASLKREDAATFSVTAGEVPPGLACILIYDPTKVGQYTHKLGKLPAGEYLFKLYDFEKLFISEPFQVREAARSIERALDANGNRQLDDPEIIRAINLWIRQEPVPGTGGRRITDATMLALLDLWVKERPIE